MRLFTLGRTELRVHPLVVVVVTAACVLGRLDELLLCACAVTLHELSHAAAAHAFACPVPSVELMPFGGVARLAPGPLSPRAESAIAAAGPVASLLSAGLTAMCGYLFPAVRGRLETFLTFNLTLAVLNLLPALPLDGGRILRAQLQRRLSYGAATRIAAWAGVAAGAALLSLAAACALRGAYNLTLPTMGVFLLLAAVSELRALPEGQMQAYLHRYDGVHTGETYAVHQVAAHASMRAREALRMLRHNRYNVLRVVDGRMRTIGEMDEGALLSAIAEGRGTAPLGELLAFDRRRRM